MGCSIFFYLKYSKKFSDKFTLSNHTRYKIHQLNGRCEEFYYKGYLNGEIGINGLIDTSGVVLANPVKPFWEHTYWYVYSQQVRTEIKAIYNPVDEFNMISGFEFRRSIIQGSYITSNVENPSETADNPGTIGGNYFPGYDIGFYMQGNLNLINNLDFVFGGRLDYNKVRRTGGYGLVANPKLALIYSEESMNLKLIYSGAFNDAKNWDKYGTTPGRLLNNPNLEPERVQNFEVDFGYKISENIYSTISAYDAFYSNVIGTAGVIILNEFGDSIETTQHQAKGSLSIQGAQADIKASYGNYNAYLNYTFTRPYNTETKDSLVRIGDIASHRVNFGLNALFFNKLNTNIRMNWVGKRETGKNTTISDNPLDVIDSYFLTNLAITYEYINGVSFQISVNNLFNSEYFHPGVRSANGGYYAATMPQNERNFMLKLLLNL